MLKNSNLDAVLTALNQLGGYFTFPGPGGKDFVIVGKDKFDQLLTEKKEIQLALPHQGANGVKEFDELDDQDKSSRLSQLDNTLESINRDLALYQEGDAEGVDDLSYSANEEQPPAPTLSEDLEKEVQVEPTRVKFEPLKGDLPPELQE